ncbi:MAG TPA: hypothetical protein VGT41_00350 [Candidatus Babeliales bacterium]|nr:hypothetical protein [Candidatus Babeliales bacterium]
MSKKIWLCALAGSVVVGSVGVAVYVMHKKPAINIAENKRFIEKELYRGIKGGGPLQEHERALIEKNYTKKTSIYGEILYDSAQALLQDPELAFGPEDIFYDLGSGVGKMAVQVYLNTPVKKVVGIELSPTRHAKAEKVMQRCTQSNIMQKGRALALCHGDMLELDIDDATIIYMCSTCYPPELLEQLVLKFSKLQPGARIISLKELPNYAQHGMEFVKEVRLPMTWSREDGSPVYIYRRTNTGVAPA